MAQLNIEIPDHLHRSLKLEAYHQGKTMKAFILELLSQIMIEAQHERLKRDRAKA